MGKQPENNSKSRYKHKLVHFSNCRLAVGERSRLCAVPLSLSHIKQEALATDRTCELPQRPPD